MTRPRFRVSTPTLLFALLSLVLGIALFWKTRAPREPSVPAPVSRSPRPRRTIALSPAPAPTRRAPVEPSPRTAEPPPPQGGTPRLAIVIDDLGNDRSAIERIASWPFPVAGAVLPALPGSASAARELGFAGKQVLLHLPMEPRSYPRVQPGPGVVLLSQSEEEIAATLERDLDTVPGAVGVNNHMGSAATADSRVMRAVTRVLARRGLFFVDSRTTGATVARDAAREDRVPSVSRRVFLDDVATEKAVETQLGQAVADARSEGFALAIGHPYAATLAVLERELPRLGEKGVKLVAVGDLVR